MKRYKRVIALISDTHFGGQYALFPPAYTDNEGNEYKANRGQKQIYNGWCDFCQRCDDVQVDTVIHLGDALHGTNRKQFGQNLMFTDLEKQKDVACDMLKSIIRKRDFLIVSGSGYHESLDCQVHKDIAKRLKGIWGGALCNLDIKNTKRKMNVAHGTSGAVVYRTTIMAKESVQILEAEALKKLQKFDIVARGHWHFFAHLHMNQQHLIQVPCWMAWEPSKPYLKYYGKMQPDIGGVILLIDNADRITVWHYLYPAPHIADAMKLI